MNKYLIIAAAVAAIGLTGCDLDQEKGEMAKTYGLERKWIAVESDREAYLIGELKMIRELLQKQVALEAARQRSSKGPNPLCE